MLHSNKNTLLIQVNHPDLSLYQSALAKFYISGAPQYSFFHVSVDSEAASPLF